MAGRPHPVSFCGGPPALRRYLRQFFFGLGPVTSPPEPELESAAMTCAVTFGWDRDTPACSATEVIAGAYEVGRGVDHARLTAPGCWAVRIFADGLDVALDRQGWRGRWDLLNQALTNALVINAAAWGVASLHAACVVTGWGTILLCGTSGAGKSTMALGAAASGATLVADDRVFVAVGGEAAPRVFTLAPPVTFRAGTAALIPALVPFEVAAEATAPPGGMWSFQYKIGVDPATAFGMPRRPAAGGTPRGVIGGGNWCQFIWVQPAARYAALRL